MMINRAVYEQLVANREGCESTREDGSIWQMVYLPNVSVKGATRHQIAGALAHLKDIGHYLPCGRDQYFGEVRVK